MRIATYEFIGGTTRVLTWVSSGVVVDSITCALRDFDDAVINTASVVSSGNGHYYAVMPHPVANRWVVNEWIAIIQANTYISRQFGNGRLLEVD